MSYEKTHRLNILRAYKKMYESKGLIRLRVLFKKRLRLYISLGVFMFFAMVIAVINQDQTLLAGIMIGAAGGAFVLDVSYIADTQRNMPFIYQFIDIKAVEKTLAEYEKNKHKKEKLNIKLMLGRAVFFVFLIIVFILMFFGQNN